MSTNSRSRSLVIGIATVVALALLAPVAVTAEEEAVVLAPVAAPAVASTSGDDVRTARALAAERALQSGDIGSMQEDRLLAIVAAAPSWDETSGYGAVEASRAAHALAGPAASTPQVPSDVRWAPARVIAVGASWDETSGYGSVEASRAARTSRSVAPAPSAAPTLSDASATTRTSPLFTASGTGFTAGGRVYLAIYDQMGVQLYETRWITANLPLAAVTGPTGHEAAFSPGSGRAGTLRETFANLCGATAMMRAYDEVTSTWSTWLTVEPACAASVEPTSGPR